MKHRTRIIVASGFFIALLAGIWVYWQSRWIPGKSEYPPPVHRMPMVDAADRSPHVPAPSRREKGDALMEGTTERMRQTAPPPPNPRTTPAAAISAPTLTPEMQMHFVRSMLHDYRGVYGENPVGSNAEITAALMGKNPKRNQFLPTDDRNLNSRGELVDHWGTPYFLHQVSGKIMEIQSAGPDRTMRTADDLLIK